MVRFFFIYVCRVVQVIISCGAGLGLKIAVFFE